MRVVAGQLMLRPKTDITIRILALVVIAKGVTTNSSLGRQPSVADLLITPFFLPLIFCQGSSGHTDRRCSLVPSESRLNHDNEVTSLILRSSMASSNAIGIQAEPV